MPVRMYLALVVTLALGSACNKTSAGAEVHALANAPGGKRICDEKALTHADELAAFASGGLDNGLLTAQQAAELARLATEVRGCGTEAAPGLDEAQTALREAELERDAGMKTELDVLAARQAVADAAFCDESLTLVAQREALVERLQAAGAASATDWVPTLKKRLQVLTVCGKK